MLVGSLSMIRKPPSCLIDFSLVIGIFTEGTGSWFVTFSI